ncbi:MAG TPA: hypothetical protein VFI61_02615 [Patescibacteria group bacterium]|nr:hypothetical protein [Patescibacteria group bacterium]
MSKKVAGNVLLSKGLEKVLNQRLWEQALESLTAEAFDKVFSDNDKGILEWKRIGANDLESQVVIVDGRGKEIKMPILLNQSATEMGFYCQYLYLGNDEDDSPCRNSADVRVQNLWKQLTG